MTVSITKPTVGASVGSWGTQINTALDAIVTEVNAQSGTFASTKALRQRTRVGVGATPVASLDTAASLTLTQNTFATGTGVTSGVLVKPDTARAFTYHGTVPGYEGTNNFYQSNPTAAKTNNAVTDNNAWSASFDYTGQKLSIFTIGKGQYYRVMVNGQYAQATQAWPSADGQWYYLAFDFGSRGLRRIRFEMSGGFFFGGVVREPTATVMATPAPTTRAIVFGDSFSEPTFVDSTAGSRTGWEGYGFQLGRILGWDDTWMSGAGGTGYLATNTGTRPTFRQRIADITAWSPDIVLVNGGGNDTSFGNSAVATEATLFWTALRAALPNATLLGTNWWKAGSSSYPAGYLTMTSGIAAACTAAGGVWLDMLTPGLWTGTGKQGTPVGDGNADVLVGSDGTHPTVEGHRTIAGYLAMLAQNSGA